MSLLYERHGFDLITPLGWGLAGEEERAARRLLRKEPPEISDRVAIYVCPECGDLLCGAITAVIDRDGADIVWREPAYSTFDYLDEAWEHEAFSLDAWPVLRFNATEYINAVASRTT
jgi:hypothetical protein